MITAATILSLVALQEFDVDGLLPGEIARWLPAVEEPEEPGAHAAGRVVDAFTGWPVAGALVETWTEETTAASNGQRLIGEVRTDSGGQFRLRVRAGAIVAEKVRVRADGYLTFPGTLGDLDLVRLHPRTGEVQGIEVVDLQGAPISGARITTTYSCAHDVPAFEVLTADSGRAVLPEYGRQDHPGDLRVRAPGFAGVKYIGASKVLAPAAGGFYRVALARRPACSARLLDRAGRELANRTLKVLDGEGHHVLATDGEGRFELRERFDGQDLSIYALGGEDEEYACGVALPQGTELRLRTRIQSALKTPDAAPPARLAITTARLETDFRLEVLVVHEDGRFERERVKRETELELPPGRVTLHYGGAFKGVRPGKQTLELQSDILTSVQLAPVPEPILTVRTTPGTAHLIIVEADGDSIGVEAREDGETKLSVPAGQALTVVARGARSRRLRVPAIAADARAAAADLRPDATLAPELDPDPAPDPAARTVTEVSVLDAAGAPLAARLTARGRGQPVVEDMTPGVFDLDAVRGEEILVNVRVRGHAETFALFTAGEAGALAIAPLPLAELILDAPWSYTVEAPFGDRLAELHPGPLEIAVAAPDGRRLALQLTLAPGERRVLKLGE